jgi:membrane peptidoglycan carboxypeptidase
MEKENKVKKTKKAKAPRQSWKPNWIPNSVYNICKALFTVLKIAAGAAATVALICIVCGFVFVGLLGAYLEEDILPNAQMVKENYDLDETSYIHYVDKNGNIQELQEIYASTDREWATYDEIPKHLIHAAVAIEDKRFYEHQGVDWITTIKACAGMFFGTGDAGGSTITQQLVKNITQDDSVTVRRKVVEIFKAQDFERRYDKKVIMEWYLNMIYFGDRNYGVKSAAAHYFGKELQDLSAAECASLISITNNPSIFSPYASEFEYEGKMTTGKDRNKIRQINTLWTMRNQGYLSEEEYQQALTEAENMVFKSGIAEPDRWVHCENTVDGEKCGYQGTVKTLGMGYRCPGWNGTCRRELTQQELDKLVDENGVLDESKVFHCPKCGHDDTLKTYKYYTCKDCHNEIKVGDNASQAVYSWFVDTVLEDVAAVLAARDGFVWAELGKQGKQLYLQLIQRGGYHIYSTLDMEVQNQVDKIYTDLEQIPDTLGAQQLQSGIVVIDNRTGDIVAMAGGVDEKVVFDAFNMATDANQQVGSSIKPLTVYAPAFEAGLITPATVIEDLPLRYIINSNGEPAAFPRNSNNRYRLSMTVLEGLIDSVNAVAINTLDRIGTRYSYEFGKNKFHLNGLYDGMNGVSDVDYAPLGLGGLTNGLTVRDMAGAYATFANHGTYREGRTYTKVYDSAGNLVIDNTQEQEKILSEKTVDYINYCLDQAVEKGTGDVADFEGMDICGKTGTTNSRKVRYFCGYTGYYTAAVWCGFEIPAEIQLVGESDHPGAQLWKKVMEPLHKGKEAIPLYNADKMVKVTICLDSGGVITDACMLDMRGNPRTMEVLVYPEDIPADCDKHIVLDYCTTGKSVANEFCQMMEQVGMQELEKRSLVKMTLSRLQAMQKATEFGLKNRKSQGLIIIDDTYIYQVDAQGNPEPFHGIAGDVNLGSDKPCLTCKKHTLENFQQYLRENEPWLKLAHPEWYEEYL